MKLTFEIPDSVSKKKTFSKSKLEREVHAILFLKLFQEGFLPYQDINQLLSVSFLESPHKKSRIKKAKPKDTNITPGKKFLELQGMWKNRTDMTDTVSYVQNLRARIGNREV